MNKIYGLQLEFKNTPQAIKQRKQFLIKNKIGICDIVESCEREKNDASDLGMKNIVLRDLISYLKENKTIENILFMGGNSKNGPEYLFRKILKTKSITIHLISKKPPKTQQFELNNRTILMVSLISPSNAANRSIGANPDYKKLKQQNSSFTTFDFRYKIYKKYFLNLN